MNSTIDVSAMPEVKATTIQRARIDGELGPGLILTQVAYEDGVGIGLEIIGTGVKFGIGAAAAIELRRLLNEWDLGVFPREHFALAE